MVNVVREWLTSVIVVTLLVSVIQMLAPEGVLQKTISFISGALLLFVLLRPLPGAEYLLLDFLEYEQDFEGGQQELQQEGLAALKNGVEEKLAERVQVQAAHFGVALQAKVETEMEKEGVPLPVDVYLDSGYNREISLWIAKELGIPEERQFWGISK